MKTLSGKHLNKKERERSVLFKLIELYIKDGQPIGSKTLMETSFQGLSSATIRNYFSSLEADGFLSQQHVSGGRIPTEKAYKTYAEEYVKYEGISGEKNEKLMTLGLPQNKEVGTYLGKASELLGELTGYPVFISAPRFDHDFVTDLKLVVIDSGRLLAAIITELGQIHTEILYTDEKPGHHAVKRMEEVLLARIKGREVTVSLSESEEKSARKIYNEIMVRFIVGYANFTREDIYTAGLSLLLSYPEFNNPEVFAGGLSLFENKENLRRLLQIGCRDSHMKYLIGNDLAEHCSSAGPCSVLVCPYALGEKIVGSIGILGPLRMPYKSLFGTLKAFSKYVSRALYQSVTDHKLSYRTPRDGGAYLIETQEAQILLEDKTREKK